MWPPPPSVGPRASAARIRVASSPAVSARTHTIGASGPGGTEPAGRAAVHVPLPSGTQTAHRGKACTRTATSARRRALPAPSRSSASPRTASACASPLAWAGRSALLTPRSRLAGPGRDHARPFGHKENATSGASGGRRAAGSAAIGRCSRESGTGGGCAGQRLPGRVVAVQRRVEGYEPAGPGARHRGQPDVIAIGRVLAGWYPQRRGGAAGGGVHGAAGQGVLEVEPEVAGEDLTAGTGVGDQPPGRCQVVEGVGDDLAEDIQVRLAGADHGWARSRCGGMAVRAHHGVVRVAGAVWPVTAWAPSPTVAYTCGRRVRRSSPQPSPATAAAA